MLRWLVLIWFFSLPVWSWQADSMPPVLYVKDGQLINHYFKVFVTEHVTKENRPLLSLQLTRLFTKEHLAVEDSDIGNNWQMGKTWKHPVDIYPYHTEMITRNGNKVPEKGTLLIFDLSKGKILSFYQPTVHITPELSWVVDKDPATVKAGEKTFTDYHLTTNPVFVGNRFVSLWWSMVPILLTLLMICYFSARQGKTALAVLKDGSGRYSLSRTQISVWTLAIGSMVATYGLIQLQVPNIPQTLVVMMGLSLFTSTTQSIKENASKSKQQAQGSAQPDPAKQDTPGPKGFADIILDAKTNTISLPKAQMLFWTVVCIGLFFYKSLIDGALWDMPAEMVTLMGASQAGYLLKDVGLKIDGAPPAPPATLSGS